ncbi:LamB/YcsF family protein [Cupriavidus taiwanensis]|uniref:5-oxoprolinase (ATP-hydrolyzing) subunit A n=1 Tax=Cupriavidus taiwanensis TaxID=164546 RepID=A0A7Z7NQN1_9BURK|nr:5-oxoprolinase subunit PxpA [Cupriavidus taiwanensis]SOZ19522.1 conserved hypothetical protein [Cupriavidus taiwanensis]SOZ97290.1 conserved hypothetical protein [Cupriavidus taiwanensis]SPC26179.1 conserved hypothetical protein [Cupriavidus taiwanensis]SPD37689.1 conserved protein of unknown function [Cupriavidus taiwanensis]
MKTIDINCDMGEGFGTYVAGDDDEMLTIASTANMACGFHAGDPNIMASLCAKAKKANVAVGAHPGYQDLIGFGRRPVDLTPKELENCIVYQVGAAAAIAAVAGHKLTHVKAHGALGHLVADEEQAARIFVNAVRTIDRNLIVSTMAATTLERVCRKNDLRLVSEIYADRAYTDEFKLASRRLPGAVIHDAKVAASRVVKMVSEGCIIAQSGKRLEVDIDTVCVHGDSLNAVPMARAVRTALEKAGYAIAPYTTLQKFQ